MAGRGTGCAEGAPRHHERSEGTPWFDEPKKVFIASDHAGYELKEQVERVLRARGFEVEDLGTSNAESTDYADYAHPLAKRVASGEVTQGVLICGTGLGMSYVANRYPGVRAAVSWAPEIATLARQHNDANVLVLPARFVSSQRRREDCRQLARRKVRRRAARSSRREDRTQVTMSA